MKVRRFQGDNMQQALRNVTQSLGPDAVIMSSRKIDDGFEVVAALDYRSDQAPSQEDIDRQLQLQQELEEAKAESKRRQRGLPPSTRFAEAAKKQQQHEQPAQASAPITQNTNRPSVEQELQARLATADEAAYEKTLKHMNGELQELKNWLVSHQGSAWDTRRPMTWDQSQLWQRCQDLGLEPAWADRIVSRITTSESIDKAWQKALSLVQSDLPIKRSEILRKGGCYALVGPTGAGKTTTIGKLAAQYVMNHGKQSVALITLDNYRVAAHDQLKTFATLLGVKWYRVGPDGDLAQLLEKTKKQSLVLVDSAGLASQDPQFSEQLAMLKSVGKRMQPLLVLPLTSQGRCLQENYEHFKPLGLTGCIFTKLDECFSLGAAMSVAALTRLPLTLVTDGPKIPDDIHYPEAEKIVRLAEQMARMARTRWQAAEAMTMATQQAH